MSVRIFVWLLFISSTSTAFTPPQPFDISEENVFEKLSKLIYNPTEVFTNALEGVFEQLGMQKWSVFTFDPSQEGSNEDYEDVVEKLTLQTVSNGLEENGFAEGRLKYMGFNKDGHEEDFLKEDVFAKDGLIPSINITLPPAIQNFTIDCKLCLVLTYGLKIAIQKSNYSFVEKKVIGFCEQIMEPLGVRVEIFCTKTIKKYGPHVDKLLKNNLIFLRKLCPYLNACLGKDKENVEENKIIKSRLENRIKKKVLKEEDKEDKDEDEDEDEDVITIVQISDIHFEKEYAEGTSTKCGLPVCCLKVYGNGTSGAYGDFKCDTSLRMVEGMVKKIASLKPTFVIFTGDVAPNNFWEETFESQMEATTTITSLLGQHLSHVYPVIGSTDIHPSHLYSSSKVTGTKQSLDHWIDRWSNLSHFNNADRNNILKGGCYLKDLPNLPNLQLLVINSAYMYTFNFFNALNHNNLFTEATRARKFVENSLILAERNHTKVILAFNHPMGTVDFIVSESVWLEKVLLKFKDTIVLVANGHSHYDEFRVIYDSVTKTPALVTFASPSVSPNNQRNPSMRLYRLHKNSSALLDYQQYALDLKALNDVALSDVSKHIKLLYSAKSEYQLADLSASSWHNLINRMEENETLLRRHMMHFNTDARRLDRVLSPLQKKQHLCRLKEVHFNKYKTCIRPLFPMPPPLPNLPSLPTRPTFPEPSFDSIGGLKCQNYFIMFLVYFVIYTIL